MLTGVKDLDELPEEYIKRLIMLKPRVVYRDLSAYRQDYITTLKQLYPDTSVIVYDTVDPITLDPKKYGNGYILK